MAWASAPSAEQRADIFVDREMRVDPGDQQEADALAAIDPGDCASSTP